MLKLVSIATTSSLALYLHALIALYEREKQRLSEIKVYVQRSKFIYMYR